MTLAKEMVGAGFSAGQALGSGGAYKAFVAAGSVQGDATPITASLGLVTGADGTTGVILPAVASGDVTLFNNTGSTLKVYPPVGGAISVAGTGVGSANAAFSQLTYKATRYIYFTSTQIIALTTA